MDIIEIITKKIGNTRGIGNIQVRYTMKNKTFFYSGRIPSDRTQFKLFRLFRFPHFPLIRRRDRVWLHFSSNGANIRRLRQEKQTPIRHLPRPSSLYVRSGAIQLRPDHSHDTRSFGLCVHGG